MPYLGYLLILSIAAVVVLCMIGKIEEKWFPWLLYVSAAGMILTTTLAGPYLVGSDIHLEYYFAQLRAGEAVRPLAMLVPQGTSILSYVSNNIWAYKLVYPLAFALIPVGSYFIFRRWVSPIRAFLGAFLILSFTPFFLELPTIPKQMIAEIFLMLAFWGTYKTHWPRRVRIPLLILCGMLMPLIHYSVGVLAVIIFGVGLLVSWIYRLPQRNGVLTVLAAVVVTGAIYFPSAQDGAVARKLCHLYNNYVPEALEVTHPDYLLLPPPEGATPPPASPKSSLLVPTLPGISNPKPEQEASRIRLPWVTNPFLGKGTLVRTLMGEHLAEANNWTRAYIGLLWLLVIFTAWGLWQLRRTKEFWIFGSGSLLIVLLCIIPGWASILNLTRLAHVALLILAVASVAVHRLRYLGPLLLILFLFSSGLVFEVTKQPNIENVTIPYNFSLSGPRLDFGTVVTEDDKAARDYVIDHNLFPIHPDNYGAHLFSEVLGPIGPRLDLLVELPKTPRPLDGYVFIRSRNTQDGSLVSWSDIGCRKAHTFEEWGLDFENDVVFQSGDTYVLRAPEYE